MRTRTTSLHKAEHIEYPSPNGYGTRVFLNKNLR